jgi:hypothetical protein
MKSLAFALVLAFAACAPVQSTMPPPAGSSNDAVRFSVERESSGVARLMLDNGAPHRIGYNLCASALQRRTATGWSEGMTDICTMQLNVLEPGADATYEKRPELTAGEYRYVTRIENPLGSPPQTIATEPFVVR